MFKKSFIIIACALPLTACMEGPNAQTGTVVGAVAGGVLGSAFGKGPGERAAAGLLGVAVGGLIGNKIGAKLDERSQQMAYQAQNEALERGQSGRVVAWNNPDRGYRGQVVPKPVYQSNGMPCREYTHTIYIGGQPETATGRACRNPNGTWRTVS